MELGHFDIHFVNNKSTKLRNHTFTFWMEYLTQWWTESGPFFQNESILEMPCVLNESEFWKWHGCVCKGYTEFWICLNMPQYVSIMPEYDLIYLNVPQDVMILMSGLIFLNVPTYSWKYLNKQLCLWQGSQYTSLSYIFDRVLNMPQALNMSGFWICCYLVLIALLLL